MLKELFGKALKCKNKKQEEKRIWTEKKVEGKSLDNRDGTLRKDKQDRRRNLWAGKIIRGVELSTV